jgi:uncharacterized membrane protein YdjX (TVP38/TMEM64 family)
MKKSKNKSHKDKFDKKDLIKSLIITLLYVLFVILIWQILSSYFISKEAVASFVARAGFWGPVLFILLQIVQNVIAPIAHYPILYAGGVLFGPVLGFLYNWIGTVIGTFLIILLAKKFGRPLVKKMVPERFIEKYDWLIKKVSPFGLFLMYVLPIFPDDEISYLVGLSNLSTKSLFVAILLGKIGGAAFGGFMGYDPIKGIIPMIIAHAIAIILAIIYFYRKKIFKKK